MLVYRMAPSHFMLVVNAANTAKDFAWISEQIKAVGDVAAIDSSSRYALIAVQGPAAREVLQPLATIDLGDIGYYRFGYGEVAAARATISRTGYTGEDGFEIFVPPNVADRVWQAILESGRSADVIPCGLGARDTLRLEAAMRLYGNDIDETTTVLEAGLGWTIGWNKGDFIGRDRLLRAEGERRRAKAGRLRDDRPRHRAPGLSSRAAAARQVGVVTSGTQTPFLKKAIGMAYVPDRAARRRAPRSTSTSAAASRRRASWRYRSIPGQGPDPSLEPTGADMPYPADLKYTKDHEWIRVSGDVAEVGITDYAQQQLGDVVFVELPDVGRQVNGGRVLRLDRIGQGRVGAVRAGQRARSSR